MRRGREERNKRRTSGAEWGRTGPNGAEWGRTEPSGLSRTQSSGAERAESNTAGRGRAVPSSPAPPLGLADAMKRDRLGRFLSPGPARQRGGAGGGRARGRLARGEGAETLTAARLGWSSARACGDPVEDGADEAGTGRALAMGHCRLCHGKFSSRSLRSISDRASGDSPEKPSPGDRVFIRDFQHLLGVAVHQDSSLSQFVCKSCHAQFYQCHSLLRSFLQRVNVCPTGQRKSCTKVGAQPPTVAEEGVCLAAEPSYWTMHWQSNGHGTRRWHHGSSRTWGLTLLGLHPSCPKAEEPRLGLRPRCCPMWMQPHLQMAALWGPGQAPHLGQASLKMRPQGNWVRSRFHLQLRMIGDFLSEDENGKKQNAQSSDESFEPYPEKKVSGKKSESKEAKKTEEPKMRKKPGPKPGWKKKLRCEREELPTIYKCPYQGCTAVYRGADGMKKHIKEHHEEVRERPCPHPGCNKVFMIDRYLQRHVKLIHTEVRNYICDECGQTFKQRKHLLVHQMRHSGAKPLQCEVCGFQCRQRASLKYHMTKHKAETELDFACDQCGRRFEKAHNLNVHMSMVHPLTQTQDKALPLEVEPPPGARSPSGTTEGQAVKPEPT
ncbi:zinc finger protein 276 isoform X2 [Heterocephalus glaber]|uniref:Zinc finger protein 276 n=1 Tax=Heterocephalus glaber TaxID=10181 RepID=A0AAX6SSN6_HETGA|nr:zinc finger protein 276 isoform X2 [Heterocephalus glaber]